MVVVGGSPFLQYITNGTVGLCCQHKLLQQSPISFTSTCVSEAGAAAFTQAHRSSIAGKNRYEEELWPQTKNVGRKLGKQNTKVSLNYHRNVNCKSQDLLFAPPGFCSLSAGFPSPKTMGMYCFQKNSTLYVATCFLVSPFEWFISSGELISTPIIILGIVLMLSSFSRK